MKLTSRAFSLVQVLVAVAVLAMGFVPIINMMGRSGTATAKARWIIMATNIARGEVDRLKRAEFDAVVDTGNDNHPTKTMDYAGSPEGTWVPVTSHPVIPNLASSSLRSTKSDAIDGFPPDYAKFEKRIDITEINMSSGAAVGPGGDSWRMAKAIIRIRWSEVLPGGEKTWRQMNYALLMPNTRIYIYQQ